MPSQRFGPLDKDSRLLHSLIIYIYEGYMLVRDG